MPMVGTGRRLQELDSRTLERRVAADPLLILPVGALEAHGPHLPLGSDLLQAEATSLALAEKLDALVAPGLPYGCCPVTRLFPGTVSHSVFVLEEMVRDLLGSFRRMGFRRVLVLSGHGDTSHMTALREGSRRAIEENGGLSVAVLCDYEFVYELRGKLSPETDGHGGLLETSRVLALAPDLVGPTRPSSRNTIPRSRVGPLDPRSWPESVQGDTGPSSADLGARIQQHVLDRLAETVEKALPRAGA